jgi:transposase
VEETLLMARKKNRDQSEPIDPAQLRLREPLRDQVTPVPAWLDHLLPEDHLARLIWAVTALLDLTPFFQGLVVTKEGPGRPAASPRLLVALWLYAFSQGVNSARELCRLCVRDLAYLWLCGGVTMNYHSLSDFRVDHGAALEQLMIDVLSRLLHAGLVELEHGAQDGMRVRASAGAASFRRQPTLEKCLQQAQTLVDALPAPTDEAAEDHDDDPPSGRQQAARERAARERLARVEAALAELPEVRAAKHTPKEREEARVSTTDPQARVMKMPDGGFRPAYNFQFTVDSAHCAVIGARVTNGGSDMNQMPPMVKQVRQWCAKLPKNWLMDGGFPSVEAIKLGTAEGMCVLAPVPAPRQEGQDRYAPRPDDSPAVAAWRQRMTMEEAKETYKLRAATVEWFNAQARERYGLQRLRVRGLLKASCIALWTAITHNLLIWIQHLVRRGFQPVPAAA